MFSERFEKFLDNVRAVWGNTVRWKGNVRAIKFHVSDKQRKYFKLLPFEHIFLLASLVIPK